MGATGRSKEASQVRQCDADDAAASTVRARHVGYTAETGRMAWQKATGYGGRSLVETAIYRYKHIIDSKLCSRLSGDQQGEVAIAIQILSCMIGIARPSSFCWV
jgi:hypothetical protein